MTTQQDTRPEPSSAGPGTQSPDGQNRQQNFDKALGERLARERVKHEKALEQAKIDAVQAFRQEYGLSDDVLTQTNSDKLKGLYQRISQLEGEVSGYRQREETQKKETKDRNISDGLRKEISKIGELVDDEAFEFVLEKYKGKLDINDKNELFLVGDPDQSLKSNLAAFLNKRNWMLKARGAPGAGSRLPLGAGIDAHGNKKEQGPLGGVEYSESERLAAFKRFAWDRK